jgi:cellulose synthase/poly-beta-1,6-N-acetylglucosamine synthase-like glycosyltransferase
MRRQGKGSRDYAMTFIPDPVCWTEVPRSITVLSRQRRRWHKGLLEVMGEHDSMFFNPRFGAIGMFAYPFLLIFEGWGVFVELLGYIIFAVSWWNGTIETDFAIAFFLVAFLCGTVLSLIGVLLGEMTPRPYPRYRQWFMLSVYALLENFGYRQFTAALRVLGTWDYLWKVGSWGHMERKGLAKRK